MKALQERKFSMYLAVADALYAAPTEVKHEIPMFDTYELRFNENIKRIMKQREIQERDSTGATRQKETQREKLIGIAVNIARKTRAFAIDHDNQVLEGIVDYSKWDLDQSADTILRDQCQIICTTAVEHLESLSPYNVKEPDLQLLQEEIDLFKGMIPVTREKIAIRKDATDELQDLFTATDQHLKKMDKVFEMVRVEHPNFYRNYKTNRAITDVGYRQLSIIGRVLDKTNKPVANVIIEEPTTKLMVFSGPEGNFRIKTMEPGVYTFSFNKKGFAEETVKVAVNKGEYSLVNVVLKEADLK